MTDGEPRVVRVRAGGGTSDYDVLVGPGLLDDLPALLDRRAPAWRYAVVSDETVGNLYGADLVRRMEEAGLEARLVTFPAGERHKVREAWADLTDRLLAAGHGRDSVVVAVGGGVTGDLAGFVAATFMRGIPVVQVPTSVVAMVDAAVGGKTGLDTPGGKNLVGAFHPPRFVVVDPGTIRTLPVEDRAGGFAEAVKHGAILDRAYGERLAERARDLLAGEVGAVTAAVLRSVELKADVVSRDERESGIREILNFGHTLGHALEASSGYRLSHGSAVSLGMVLEARLGERVGATRKGTAAGLERTLSRFGLPTRPVAAVLFGEGGADGTPPGPGEGATRLLDLVARDKKGRRGRTRYVLLREPGVVAAGPSGWSTEVDDGAVRAVLEEALASA
ncbi:MAG: 3-dehydroquinate synthase [Gemmatimonadota bacterium]|jgi:3-dehydroquinate synthase